MRKQQTSVTLKPTTVEYLDRLAEINRCKRSNVIDFLSEMVQDYFNEPKLRIEYDTRWRMEEMKKARD